MTTRTADGNLRSRADRIGEFWGYPESRTFAEPLIDCEEDRMLRAVLVGMLREVTGPPRGVTAPEGRRIGPTLAGSRMQARLIV